MDKQIIKGVLSRFLLIVGYVAVVLLCCCSCLASLKARMIIDDEVLANSCCVHATHSSASADACRARGCIDGSDGWVSHFAWDLLQLLPDANMLEAV